MPEIAESPPKGAKVVASERWTPHLTETYQGFFDRNDRGSSPDSALVNLRVGYFNQLLRRAHPNTPEDVIENISNLYTGPLSLSPDTLKNGTKEQSQKELSARVQHHFSHLLLHASQPDSDPKFQERLYGLFSEITKSAHSRLGSELKILQFLNGIKSEVAIIRALLENDFSVLLPDYMVKSNPQKGVSSEVLEWDVRAGVDLVGISPAGKFFLIDAKGKKFVERNGSASGVKSAEDVNRDVDALVQPATITSLPGSLQKAIRNASSTRGIQEPRINRARIVIPTSDDEVGRLGAKHSSNTYADAFAGYANLSQVHKDSIIQALK